jgi:hypothetical protein
MWRAVDPDREPPWRVGNVEPEEGEDPVDVDEKERACGGEHLDTAASLPDSLKASVIGVDA